MKYLTHILILLLAVVSCSKDAPPEFVVLEGNPYSTKYDGEPWAYRLDTSFFKFNNYYKHEVTFAFKEELFPDIVPNKTLIYYYYRDDSAALKNASIDYEQNIISTETPFFKSDYDAGGEYNLTLFLYYQNEKANRLDFTIEY